MLWTCLDIQHIRHNPPVAICRADFGFSLHDFAVELRDRLFRFTFHVVEPRVLPFKPAFTLSNLGFVRSNLPFSLSNFGFVRSIHLLILSACSVTVLKSDLRSDEKAEAWEQGRGKLSPELWVARRSFLPSRDASASSKYAADCDGRQQEMLDMLCMVDLAYSHQT
jgi:hypothetical protein